MVPLICCPGGRFSSLLPLLLPPLCLSLSRVQGDCTPPNVPFASLRSGEPKDSYPVGTRLDYRCIPGYEPIPGQTLSLTCLATSKWSTENPKFCQGRRCPAITFENGRIVKSTDLRLGDEITLGCNEGYRLIGQKTLRCILTHSGVDWNRELPLCQQETLWHGGFGSFPCEDLGPTCFTEDPVCFGEGGNIFTTAHYGSVFRCNMPTIRIPCFPPPNIANGRHNGHPHEDYNHGSAVTYTCNPTFSLIGSPTITCLTAADGVNGEWRPAAPECKVVSCHRPHIENGGLTTTFQSSYTYGSLLKYVCDHGYTRVGSDSSKCEADSAWHPPPPKCVKGIFTTAVATISPGNGHENTTSAGPTTGSTTEEEIPHPETGSTPSPKTKSPRDITESYGSPGIIIGSVVAVLAGLCLIAAAWKYKSCFKKRNTDPSSCTPESYRAVATQGEMNLEPKAS